MMCAPPALRSHGPLKRAGLFIPAASVGGACTADPSTPARVHSTACSSVRARAIPQLQLGHAERRALNDGAATAALCLGRRQAQISPSVSGARVQRSAVIRHAQRHDHRRLIRRLVLALALVLAPGRAAGGARRLRRGVARK